tara:strand:+ start:8921 stop:10357 length:1437 start_codon:yes stop_codon:yes gene_type:complete
MATNAISNLQLYAPKSWSGLTTENHLGSVFAQEPTLVSNIISRVFGLNQYAGMDYFLSIGGGEQELPDDNDFEWLLKGDDEKALPIMSTITSQGANGATILLVLGEKYFAKTDKLVLDDGETALRVMEEPYAQGMNWVYPCRTMVFSSSAVADSLLTAGSRVSKEYSPQERTLNRTYGETSYTSPFKMRNSMSFLSKTYTVPGNMHQRPLVIEMLDPKSNKTSKIWTQYAEWEFICQWAKEKERMLWFSKSNKQANGTYNMMGDSGTPIIEGAGIREQISPSYKFNYNEFTIDFLEDVLLNLSINILPEDQRHFVAFTGERGMVQFHRALENHAARFQPLDSKRVGGAGQNLSFQGQYREYMGPQGIRFTLVHLPLYDNEVRNRIAHPKGGHTESYRYTILNMGTSGGEKNIKRVYPKGRKELMWHVAGSTSPLGPNTSFSKGSASAVDGYQLFAQAQQGVLIANPMSCCELIYNSTI